jgi:CHAT domain-containing protein
MRKGLYTDSLAVLQSPIPSGLVSSDIAIWRELTLGADYCYREDFAKAEAELTQAETLANAGHPELLGEVSLRKGTLADLAGDRQSAISLYRQALESARVYNDSYLEASALGNLGMVSMEQEHFDESINWDSQTLRVSETVGDRRSVAKTLVNMSWGYVEMGDYERALDMFQQAEESSRKTGLVHEQIICRMNRGAVYYYQRNYETANQESLTALGLARERDEKLLIVESLNNLSDIALAKLQPDLAERYNHEAQELSRSLSEHPEMPSELIATRIDIARKHFRKAEGGLSKVIKDPAASATLRWEAEARLAKVYDEENRPKKAEQEYKRSITTIQTARRSIQEDELRLAFLSSAIDFYDDYVDFLIQHHRVEDALRVADLTRSQTLVEGLFSSNGKPRSVTLGKQSPLELARKLHATLLIYWLGQNHSYLWVVTPAKLSCFPLPPKSQIEPVVKAYRQRILEGRDVLSADNEVGQQLYSTLVAPAHTLIGKSARAILFPAEGLYGLNFETLIVPGASPHFWIEDVTLSTASALAMPPSASQQMPGKQKSLLLVGNPEPASPDFPRLAQAPAEMQKISSHFSQANRDVLEGTHATPGSYLSSNPGQFSYLHFVTHGTASHTRPLESAVILSREGDSYKLYARDIVQHPLKAELVTISACNGAGTRAYAGEGLVGLSWAFLRAGAHNVIGALWEVSDASSTPQLMDAMYAGIDKGQDPATALRNAKLAILHASASSVFKKPFYWAPFQLYTGS